MYSRRAVLGIATSRALLVMLDEATDTFHDVLDMPDIAYEAFNMAVDISDELNARVRLLSDKDYGQTERRNYK